MTLIDEDITAAEARTNLLLRVAGIVVLVAAALGSINAASDPSVLPHSDSCVLNTASGTGFTGGCTEAPTDEAGGDTGLGTRLAEIAEDDAATVTVR